jgi:hypothetical protein
MPKDMNTVYALYINSIIRIYSIYYIPVYEESVGEKRRGEKRREEREREREREEFHSSL